MMVSQPNTTHRRRAEDIDRLVRKIIIDARKPVSAYAIVAETKRLGSPMVPTQVYRSIDRLLDRRRVERIPSLKAYVAAHKEQRLHLICEECGVVTSARAREVEPLLAELCKATRFSRSMNHLECRGRCEECQVGR